MIKGETIYRIKKFRYLESSHTRLGTNKGNKNKFNFGETSIVKEDTVADKQLFYR